MNENLSVLSAVMIPSIKAILPTPPADMQPLRHVSLKAATFTSLNPLQLFFSHTASNWTQNFQTWTWTVYNTLFH